jgi:hypothetical protein
VSSSPSSRGRSFSKSLALVVLLGVFVSACTDRATDQVVPSNSSPPIAPSSTPVPTPSPTHEPVDHVQVSVPNPGGVVIAFGGIWVQSGRDLWKVSRDGRVLERYGDVTASPGLAYMGVGGGGYQTLAAGFGSLWNLVKGKVLRVDPRSGEVLSSIQVPDGMGSIAVGAGAVWVACCSSGVPTLFKIDPLTNQISDRRNTGESIASLAFGAGAVWVLGIGEVPQLMKFDPATLGVIGQTGAGARGLVAAGSDDVWVMDHGSTLDHVDPARMKSVGTVDVGGTMMAIAVAGRGVYVNAGDLLWVSASGHVKTVAFVAEATTATAGIAVDVNEGSSVIWLTEPTEDTLVAVPSSLG